MNLPRLNSYSPNPTLSSQPCRWQINSVEVNSKMAAASDFRILETSDSQIRIEPLGLSFAIQHESKEGFILRSGSQLYFGLFDQEEDRLHVTLTRPVYSDRVVISAQQIDA